MSTTVGSCSRWMIMASELSPSSRIKSSECLNACMAVTNTREVELDWRSVNVLWNSTAAVFGWTNLSLEEERPSASQSRPEPDSSKQSSSEPVAPRTVLLVEDNETDV